MVPVLRPPPTGQDKGGPSGPPPTRRRSLVLPAGGGGAPGGSVSDWFPPLVAGVIGGPRPPHPTPGATSPSGPPD